MPTLKIIPMYEENKQRYAPKLAQTRADLEQFRSSLVARFGKVGADAITMHAQWTEDMLFGRVEVLPLLKEAEDAVDTLRMLRKKVRVVRKKICANECYFHEKPTPISVLETVGLSWEEVRRRCSDDGLLPVSGVLWLLDVLCTREQMMPSDEQVTEWAASGLDPCHLPVEWRRILRKRRVRLTFLLQMAVILEVEVQVRGD